MFEDMKGVKKESRNRVVLCNSIILREDERRKNRYKGFGFEFVCIRGLGSAVGFWFIMCIFEV